MGKNQNPNAYVTTFTLPKTEGKRLDRWTTKTKLSAAKLVRRLLALIPFLSIDRVELVIIKIPKPVAADPQRLADWLSAAVEEIKEHYGDSAALARNTSTASNM